MTQRHARISHGSPLVPLELTLLQAISIRQAGKNCEESQD